MRTAKRRMLALSAVVVAAVLAPAHGGPRPGRPKEPSLGPALEQPCTVLIIDGEPAKRPLDSETYCLRTAMDPTGKGLARSTRTVGLLPAAFRCKLLILANVETLSRAGARLVETHVRTGGSLLIFCGDRVDPVGYNRRLYRDGKGVLPGRMGKPIIADREKKDAAARLDHRTWQIGKFQQTVLAEPRLLRDVAVTGRIDVEPDKAARVTLKYTDGRPAVLEKKSGQGQVVLVTTSCDAEWSTLPVSPIYVVLVCELIEGCGVTAPKVTPHNK